MENRDSSHPASHDLIVEGARQNNLKNISLRIPHNQVTAITGLSGSGKSSLAFDTLFAEGQWRYVESLSTYARMFLDKVNRPDVDRMVNIRPAIAIEQKKPHSNGAFHGGNGHGDRGSAAASLRQDREACLSRLPPRGSRLPPGITGRRAVGPISQRASDGPLPRQGSWSRPRSVVARLLAEARLYQATVRR